MSKCKNTGTHGHYLSPSPVTPLISVPVSVLFIPLSLFNLSASLPFSLSAFHILFPSLLLPLPFFWPFVSPAPSSALACVLLLRRVLAPPLRLTSVTSLVAPPVLLFIAVCLSIFLVPASLLVWRFLFPPLHLLFLLLFLLTSFFSGFFLSAFAVRVWKRRKKINTRVYWCTAEPSALKFSNSTKCSCFLFCTRAAAAAAGGVWIWLAGWVRGGRVIRWAGGWWGWWGRVGGFHLLVLSHDHLGGILQMFPQLIPEREFTDYQYLRKLNGHEHILKCFGNTVIRVLPIINKYKHNPAWHSSQLHKKRQAKDNWSSTDTSWQHNRSEVRLTSVLPGQ